MPQSTSKLRTLPLVLCVLAVVAAIAAVALAQARPASAAAAAAGHKLVILGFDGVDAKLTEQWMNEGKLPHLAKLRAQGTFAPLLPTLPSQTPVSWSTFSTGLSPGRHGIFDFLKRDPANYKPSFAMYDEKRTPFLWGTANPWIVGVGGALALALVFFLLLKLFRLRTRPAFVTALVLGVALGIGAGAAAARLLPVDRPNATNRQQGEPFWSILGKEGKRVRVIRVPVTFPPKPFEHGELLAGLGTPDLSGRIGKPFYFTSELFFTPKGGGDFKVEVTELPDNKGALDTGNKGPPNEPVPKQKEKGKDYISIPMRLTVAADKKSLRIDVSGQHLSLKPGEWSDWQRFAFPFNSIIKLKGIGRFRLLSLEPEVRLYLSPIEFDPENLPPILDITTPPRFVHQMTDRFGLFKTMGWQIDTWSMDSGTIPEEVFLEDVKKTVDKDL